MTLAYGFSFTFSKELEKPLSVEYTFPGTPSAYRLEPVVADGTFEKERVLGTWCFQEKCSSLIKGTQPVPVYVSRKEHIVNSTW